MVYSTFAAIDVGSGELVCKIYELSKKYGIRQLDCVRHSMPLGAETYRSGKLSHSTIEEICDVLNGFNRKMEEYRVESYVAHATSAIREATNSVMILEQIKLRTGMKVKLLSNSEQRFLYYKAMAAFDEFYEKVSTQNTLIVDVGAGSVQLSLLSDTTLKMTQNIKIGFLRVRELLSSMEQESDAFYNIISEYMNNDLSTFRRLMLPDVKIKNLISVSDHLASLRTYLIDSSEKNYITRKAFLEFCHKIRHTPMEEICKQLSITKERVNLLIPTLIIYEKICLTADVERIWLSQTTLCDGIAADYCERKEKVTIGRDFTADILSATREIAVRYQSNVAHTDQVEYLALAVFDAVAKPFGLNKRDRLLLQMAVILHTCGEFINMNRVPENSYSIIMSTEIIGLSHKERELVANVVRYDTDEFPRYTAYIDGLDRDTYMKVAKLTGILRLANIMDKSHLQKFTDVKVTLKDTKLQVLVTTLEDMTLERGLFGPKAEFFEEVFGVLPVLKQKRRA